MKPNCIFSFILLLCCITAVAQPAVIRYRKVTAMIPMRDGIKLFTTILEPVNAAGPVPILLQRTPYGAALNTGQDSTFSLEGWTQMRPMTREGYIFVLQDIRGKYQSEGSMQIHQPLIHQLDKNAVDESTDTWDAIDWLIKQVPGNNGKAGILGISYPGWLALVGSVDPHPALKASSEQACMSDLFLGDDFHHNGAFRLSYGFEYAYELEHDKTTDSDFPFPQYDLFDWYLQLGSLKNVNDRFFHGSIPTWNNFMAHPNYDDWWQKNSPLSYIHTAQVPQLHVGGYYDQEDLNGPQLMYAHLEKTDTFNRNHIVLGPWNHGQWGRNKGDSLGDISFGSNTGEWFRELQAKWFDFYLKGNGDGKFDEAYCFQTGSNKWKTYESWPPKKAVIKNLYGTAAGKASFTAPAAAPETISFISDPAKPVPYRPLPIEATYGRGSRWGSWQVADQRFVYTRPDVISFTLDSLEKNLTVTGAVTAHLFASTTGTDADWIVKLIDVYPAADSADLSMSGYQLPVAMEVFRGRYNKSFVNPAALVPGRPTEFTFSLHQINHCFLKGHRIMIQVQSSWFPVIDRNPQKFTPNIFNAQAGDFIKATETIYCTPTYPTHLSLPVMAE